MPCVAGLCECIPCFANEYTLLCKEYALLYKEYARDHPGVTVLEESFFDDEFRFASQTMSSSRSSHTFMLLPRSNAFFVCSEYFTTLCPRKYWISLIFVTRKRNLHLCWNGIEEMGYDVELRDEKIIERDAHKHS